MKRVADCLVEKNGQGLLVKASYRDYWQFPGGHAEDGQTPIVLQADELAEFAWVLIDEAAARLHPLVRPLLPHALQALEKGHAIYLEGGQIIK